MNRSKSRGNRPKISLVQSPSCRDDVDLSVGDNLLHTSVHCESITFATGARAPRTVDDTGTLSDEANDALPSRGIEKLRIRNGFKINTYQPLRKGKHIESKFDDAEISINSVAAFNDSVSDSLSELDKPTKPCKSASTSSHMPDIDLDLRNSINTEIDDVNLPPFEESIIEGFSIIAFSTLSEADLYARLTEKSEEISNPRTSSRASSTTTLNCIPGRRRRCSPRHSTSRGKKSTLHASTSDDANASSNRTVGETSISAKDNDDKCDSERLGPFHIDIIPSISITSNGRKVGSEMASRHNELDQNGSRITNGEACFMPSVDKTFPILSPKNTITSSTKTTGSSATPKRDLFSIAALTAVEERKEAPLTTKAPLEQQQPQMHSRQVSQPPHARQNGHQVTPAQWLECLSNRGTEIPWNKQGAGDAKVAEEELHQLTRLLFTDRAFTEQVSRLPPGAFYNEHQHTQLRQQKQQRCHTSSSSSSSSSVTQSFANILNSQQNSVSVGVPQNATAVSSVSLTNSKPPSSLHPSLAFGPSVDSPVSSGAVMNVASTSGSSAHFKPSMNSVSATATTSIHPPLLTPSAAFFNSNAAAFAAALVAGMRPPAPVFQGQGHFTPTGQFLHAPISTTTSTSIPPAHHPFMLNSSHLSALWSHHQPPRLQPPGADFPYLMTPSPHPSTSIPSTNSSHARKVIPMDAVDLTSVSSGGSGLDNRPPVAQPPLSFPNFWAHQRPPAVGTSLLQQPQSQPPPPSARRLHQLPNFRDLFRTEGVNFNRGATAHLRICYHILKNKTHGLKSVNPSHPWWYIEPNPALSQPKPREHLQPQPQVSHHQTPPRFPNYEHFIRTALAGGGGANCAAPLLPLHPIAIDLTRSPQPSMVSQHREVPHSLDLSMAAKVLQHHQRQQEADLMMALKRRRVMPEGGPLIPPLPVQPQLLSPAHYQNGGIQIPLGLPFPHPRFRQLF